MNHKKTLIICIALTILITGSFWIKNNPTEGGNLASSSVDTSGCSTGHARSISQFGITWFFQECERYGNFANGDYWVVAPVTIWKITPEDDNPNDGWDKHGTMTDFGWGWAHGFDSSSSDWLYYSDGHLNVAPTNISPTTSAKPLVVTTPKSVVSSISQTTQKNRPQWLTAAVLTVLNTEPAPGSFRPAIASVDKTVYWNKSQLNYDILQKLTPPASGSAPDLATVTGYFEKPWFAHMEGTTVQYISPLYNMPNYGRDQAHQVTDALLSLHLDYSNAAKEQLYVRLVQYGIDIYGSMKDRKDAVKPTQDYAFTDNAGLNAGRKAPLVLAALALNDAGMKVYANAGQKNLFSEDRQTWIVTQDDVNRYVLPEPGAPEFKPRETYRQEHVGLAEWGDAHTIDPRRDDSRWHDALGGAAYRWVGGPLAGNALGIKLVTGGVAAWNHQPFFKYAERFFNIETLNGSSYEATANHWAYPNNISRFTYDMWRLYYGGTTGPTTASLNVSRVGNGKVTAPGIDCGIVDCGESYTITTSPTSVTLTAVPTPPATFIGWSGEGCSGTASTCTVTMNVSRFITATFTTPGDEPFAVGKRVEVTMAGNPGSNTINVRSAPSTSGSTLQGTQNKTSKGTIVCPTGQTCPTITGDNTTWWYINYDEAGTLATGVTGWNGDGWSGQDNLKVIPGDTPITHTLTTSVSGSGTISGNTSPYDNGEQATLTATAHTGHTFTSWSGDCTGSASCVITMNGAKTVTATFTQAPPTRSCKPWN